MAYVNEFASDEDIEKYRLNEVWDRYHPHEKENRFWGRKPELTIDHDGNAFMMVVSRGRVTSGTQFKFLVSIRGEEVFVYLNLVEGSSPKLTDRPFYRVWDFVTIDKRDGGNLADTEILEEVKRAVTAFGYNGPRRQVPETVVKFGF